MQKQHIVLYDGDCNLCNTTVNFIQKRDYQKLFSLISLQSEEGQFYLQQNNLPLHNFDTAILIENNEVYTASTAGLRIIKELSGGVKYLSIFIVLPSCIRDPLYTLFAKNRYKLFGKKQSCNLTT